jgi:hypothetical protein
MSFQAMEWAARQTCPDALSKLILLMIAHGANDNNECWPSLYELSKQCLMTEYCLSRRLGLLKTRGLLIVERRFRPDGGQEPNLYRIPL